MMARCSLVLQVVALMLVTIAECQQYLYRCNLEGDQQTNPCFIQQTNDNFDWTLTSGPTPSGRANAGTTGPPNDHTCNAPQGRYLYIETSSPRAQGDIARMRTPTLSGGFLVCLEFWFHALGPHVGALRAINTDNPNTAFQRTNTIFEYVVNKAGFNDTWIKIQNEFSAAAQFDIAFEGVRYNGWGGDISIDDVVMYSGRCITNRDASFMDCNTPFGPTGVVVTGGPTAGPTTRPTPPPVTRPPTTPPTQTPVSTRGPITPGPSVPVCQQPKQVGFCTTGVQSPSVRYFFNSQTLFCEPFTYVGCGGNNNNFESQQDCENVCGQFSGCLRTSTGRLYRGRKNFTPSGRQCQSWASNSPHNHAGLVSQDARFFPDATLADASNYCRNPDNRATGPWCFTTDSNVRSESCDVLDCGFWRCTFEGNVVSESLCGFQQVQTDNFDWSWNRGQTQTSNTGPNADHTYVNSEGRYLYIEASSPRRMGDIARLASPQINRQGPICLTFWYHMFGDGLGDLRVLESTSNFASRIIWNKRGVSDQRWIKGTVTLAASGSFLNNFAIEATVGASIQGDIALDDLTLSTGACAGTPQPTNPPTSGPTQPPVTFFPGQTAIPGLGPGSSKYHGCYTKGARCFVSTGTGSWVAPPGPQGQPGPSGAAGPMGPSGPPGIRGPSGLPGPFGPTGPVGASGPQGVQGPPGPFGPSGPIGLTGPPGVRGETGSQGVEGRVGPRGFQGPSGNPGTTGGTGLRGPTGNPGVQGVQGPPGLEGPRGQTGASGPSGPFGPIGRTGPVGPVGPVGARGPEGPMGPQGIRGFTGRRGETGASGRPGPTGLQGFPGLRGPQGFIGASGRPGPVGPVGRVGPTGPVGPQGTPGLRGPEGIQGRQGLTGPSGPSGPRGTPGGPGALGPIGPKGDRGVSGPQGARGLPGLTGNKGDIGPVGPVGPRGFVGPQGLRGGPGQTGPVGPKGSQGVPGPFGPVGPVGPIGPKGSQGIQGIVGRQGQPGRIGATGPRGLVGLPGRTGATGPTGPLGSTGATGRTGPTGPIGPQGLSGRRGSPGSPGQTGAQGPPGIQGPAGPQGLLGPQGPVGPVGPLGPQGPRGFEGATGPTGIAGPPGPRGDIGQSGSQGPKGDPGNPGPQGSPGRDGLQGAVGQIGATGPSGPPGQQGLPGGPVVVRNECERNNGGCEHICVDTYDGYCCLCRTGYELIPLDTFNCRVEDLSCHDTLGAGYQCVCRVGNIFIPLNGTKCLNANECKIRNGGCEHNCVDNDGSYTCTCNTGFRLASDGRGCIDVDECRLGNPCPVGEYCINTYGRYYCAQNRVNEQAPRAQGVKASMPNDGTGNASTIVSSVTTGVIGAAFALVMNFIIIFFVRRLRRKRRTIKENKENKSDDGLSDASIDARMFRPALVTANGNLAEENSQQ